MELNTDAINVGDAKPIPWSELVASFLVVFFDISTNHPEAQADSSRVG